LGPEIPSGSEGAFRFGAQKTLRHEGAGFEFAKLNPAGELAPRARQ
jgi:hypothetical protein